MTKVSVEELSPIERRIKVEVPPEDVSTALEQAYKILSHRVRVPGFRPGKVPRRILEARYKDQVESDVIQTLVETSYRQALVENNVPAVSSPRVTNEGLKKGEPFRYQAQVEVRPVVEAKDYEGLELKREKVEIGDHKIDAEIERIRDTLAELVPVEGRAAKKGDWAIVNFEGTVDGKPFPGSKAENVTVEIDAGEFTEGKAPQLEGANVNETRDISFSFPADYKPTEFAGKTAIMKVSVVAIREKKTPAIDDELAKDVGGGNTLQELKDRIRKDLEAKKKDEIERGLREEVIKQLVNRNPFEVPQSMIERAVDNMLQGAVDRFARQGMDVRRMNLDFNRLREEMRGTAEAEVRGTLLLESIAKKEKIDVTPEDYDKRIKELAEQMKTPEDRLRSMLGPQEKSGIEHRIREEKTLAFIESKAKIP